MQVLPVLPNLSTLLQALLHPVSPPRDPTAPPGSPPWDQITPPESDVRILITPLALPSSAPVLPAAASRGPALAMPAAVPAPVSIRRAVKYSFYD